MFEKIQPNNDWLRTIIINLVVAVLYLLTGYLGLFLAASPGYATPIWIPSGIALGAAFIYGLRILPETKQQLDLLKKMGCEYFQGYYYSPPAPLKTLLIQATKTKY